MEKFFKGISVIFLVLGIAISITKLAPWFLPATSDLVMFADRIGSGGYMLILLGALIGYQMKIVEMSREIRQLRSQLKDNVK